MPKGRLELGALQNAHYGVTDRVQVSLHPVWFFILPHVEVKALAWEASALSVAVQGRLAYPTVFLGLISRAGAGGLLPATSSPPQALQVEGDVLGTLSWGAHATTAGLGLAVAPHAPFEPPELPLLDFPFLYPRFAPLYTVVVPRARLGLEGRVWRSLFYSASALAFLLPELPDVGTSYAVEEAVSLEQRLGARVGVSLGLRASQARYAFGTRLHLLPYADVRLGF